MAILIDGYNLLYATDIFGRPSSPATLEASRNALLDFLAAAIDADELPYATVVFDAKDAPPGLPRQRTHRGLHVQFADTPGEADDVLEQLIRVHTAPHRLVVVSSDHRVQRAARRRRAKAIDSDQWYAEVLRRRKTANRAAPDWDVKPDQSMSESELRHWLREFGVSTTKPQTTIQQAGDAEKQLFPPGYGEDVAEEED